MLIQDDSAVEQDEDFFVDLERTSNLHYEITLTNTRSTVCILNDDSELK